MPEHNVNKQERLISGETTVTGSSDEAIEATIAQLSREIRGLNSSEEIIEGEPLAPISITPPIAIDNGSVSKNRSANIESLKYHDSAFGNLIRKRRLGKKAA